MCAMQGQEKRKSCLHDSTRVGHPGVHGPRGARGNESENSYYNFGLHVVKFAGTGRLESVGAMSWNWGVLVDREG